MNENNITLSDINKVIKVLKRSRIVHQILLDSNEIPPHMLEYLLSKAVIVEVQGNSKDKNGSHDYRYQVDVLRSNEILKSLTEKLANKKLARENIYAPILDLESGSEAFKVPLFIEFILQHFLTKIEQEGLLGDLQELYFELSLQRGVLVANVWYLWQAFTFIGPIAMRSAVRLLSFHRHAPL